MLTKMALKSKKDRKFSKRDGLTNVSVSMLGVLLSVLLALVLLVGLSTTPETCRQHLCNNNCNVTTRQQFTEISKPLRHIFVSDIKILLSTWH